MKKSRISISRICVFLLAVIFISGISTMAYAKYEITKSDVTSDVPTDGVTIVRWTQDVTIEWEQPTISSGDSLQGFVYRWNTTATQLTDLTEANADGTVSNSVDPPYVTKAASFFATDDSDVIRYLHIRTWFYDNTTHTVTYSDDVVIGGINIDNVAPTGTVSITDSEGSSIDSTYSTSLNLRLSASKAPAKVYVNETANRDTATSSTYASAVTYTLNNTDPGSKTIYVWFEDTAGNVSSAAVTDTVTVLSSVSISPYDGTFDIALEEKAFIVDGTDATYNWTITELSGTDVADFIGTSTDTNGVTVGLYNPGTFNLTATPTGAGDPIESGTITVIQSSITSDINLAVGWNLISIPSLPSDTAIATVLAPVSGKYSVVWGEFDPTASTWKNYNPAKPVNTLTVMEPRKGYWINCTEACVLSVTGAEAETSTSLSAGWNLVGFAGANEEAIATVLSSITGSYSVVWGEFNPTASTWKNYNPAKPVNTLTTMGPGKGYWINCSESASLTY